MAHELDPGTPLFHSDGTEYSVEEREAFFRNVENSVRKQYADARANHFSSTLSIGQQLDLLWHELDATGAISKNGAWFNAVKAVKDSYPKDDVAYLKAVQDVAELRKKLGNK